MKIINNLLPKTFNKKSLWRTTRKYDNVNTIVIHYISAVNINKKDPFNKTEIINIFKKYRCSSHYLIERDGTIIKLVDEKNVAFHAGKSSLHGFSINNSVNDNSIGIELVGGQWIDFTNIQYDSLTNLIKDIKTRNIIPKENIVGHSIVSPKRKIDPGKHFDWRKLFDGLFPESVKHQNKLDRKVETINVGIAKNELKNKPIENAFSKKNLLQRIIEKIKILFNKGK